jgi:hypothetical protein
MNSAIVRKYLKSIVTFILMIVFPAEIVLFLGDLIGVVDVPILIYLIIPLLVIGTLIAPATAMVLIWLRHQAGQHDGQHNGRDPGLDVKKLGSKQLIKYASIVTLMGNAIADAGLFLLDWAGVVNLPRGAYFNFSFGIVIAIWIPVILILALRLVRPEDDK